jgi:hypothetical protein
MAGARRHPQSGELLAAIRSGDCAAIDRLFFRDNSLLQATRPLGLTALHAAVVQMHKTSH